MSEILYWITAAIILFAMYGSFNLSTYDYKKKNVCPKIAGIPACYIVFVFFTAAGISHFINIPLGNQLYFAFVGVPALIALIGTVVELSGKVICPRTKSGVPMCYISLGLCLVLMVVKYFSF